MRRSMGVGLLVLVWALAGCKANGGQAAPSGSPSVSASAGGWAAGGPYAALGDSYTAGLQLKPAGGGPKGCGRSAVDYPSLVAQGLGLAGSGQFTDVSCSSATTDDLTGPQQVEGGPNPPQLDALNSQTKLVTVGIGGNDAGFSSVLKQCAEEGLLHMVAAARGDAPCKAHYTAADGSNTMTAKLKTVGDRLAGMLHQVSQRSPQAKVFVVGYPDLLPADPASCWGTLGPTITKGDLAFIADQEQQLNTVLRTQAAAGGAVYVDTYAPSQGHDMCTGRSTRWIEPPAAADNMAPLHPNQAGAQQMAATVLASIRAAH